MINIISYFNVFPNITLSNFQKWAFKSIVDKQHILITAHTGSGKTLPAEFAILHLLNSKKKLFILHLLKLYLIQNFVILKKIS